MSIRSRVRAFFSVRIETLSNLLFKVDTTKRGVLTVDNSKPEYNLASPKRVDVKITRGLYRNSLPQYKLSGHLTKPIIDSNVSFIDKPEVRSPDDKTEGFLKSLMPFIPFEAVHRVALRDGKCMVWAQWNQFLDRIDFVVIPPETVKGTIVDPVSKKIQGYVFHERVQYFKDKDAVKTETHSYANVTVEIDITSMKVTVHDEDTGKEKITTQRNPFGFLPIVPFIHDNEPWENEGHSDLENIEPTLKFYHDMTIEAGSAQKRDGHPKSKIKTPNIREWLANNFGEGTYEQVRAGGASISLQDRDLFLCSTAGESEEDVQYIELNKTTGDYAVLSEIAFTNIVEGSQTPEIIFGANLGTSLASVREQRPVWIKKVQKLQSKLSLAWEQVFRIALQLQGFVEFREYSEDLKLIWPTPDFSSYKEKADTLNVLTNALVKLKNARIASDEEIHETMLGLDNIDLKHNYKKHSEEVEATSNLIIERIAAEHLQKMEQMNRRSLEDDTEVDDEPSTKDEE